MSKAEALYYLITINFFIIVLVVNSLRTLYGDSS